MLTVQLYIEARLLTLQAKESKSKTINIFLASVKTTHK